MSERVLFAQSSSRIRHMNKRNRNLYLGIIIISTATGTCFSKIMVCYSSF